MSKETNELYETEVNGRDVAAEKELPERRPRRHTPSLFGPIVLIAIGVFFLLNNLGLLPPTSLNWGAVWQLWPLLLVFIGLNIIVKQAPQPLGGFLSALVGLMAVGIFGYVLLFSEDNPLLARFGFRPDTVDVQQQQISFPADGVERAQVTIDFGLAGADVMALSDSNDLIAGSVSYIGDLRFDADTAGSTATVYLSEENRGLFWLNPTYWGSTQMERWQLGLSPRVALDVHFDAGAGSVELELSELSLTDLTVDGGAGGLTAVLPGGDYEGNFDIGAGAARLTMGENGRQTIEIDGGAGSITLFMPPNREARLEVEDGAGSFNMDDARFTQVRGRANDDGIWQTAGYNRSADDALLIILDIGAGSVTVREVGQ
jgi:hypothetical protein